MNENNENSTQKCRNQYKDGASNIERLAKLAAKACILRHGAIASALLALLMVGAVHRVLLQHVATSCSLRQLGGAWCRTLWEVTNIENKCSRAQKPPQVPTCTCWEAGMGHRQLRYPLPRT